MFQLYVIISYFCMAVTKHHDQPTYRRAYLGLVVPEVRVCDGWTSWQQTGMEAETAENTFQTQTGNR